MMPQFKLSEFSSHLGENDKVNQSHLLITLARIEYCLDLSFEYRYEKLRREFEEKYIINKDAPFEWYPEALFGEIIGCDLSQYHWYYRDPGVWLAGRHLNHYGAVPTEERTTLHLAFRSTQEIEIIFYAFIDCSFFNSQRKRNYKRIKMAQNRLTDLLNKFGSHQPLA